MPSQKAAGDLGLKCAPKGVADHSHVKVPRTSSATTLAGSMSLSDLRCSSDHVG